MVADKQFPPERRRRGQGEMLLHAFDQIIAMDYPRVHAETVFFTDDFLRSVIHGPRTQAPSTE